MKAYKYIVYCVLAMMMVGCTITGRMSRRELNAGLDYKKKPPVENAKQQAEVKDSLPKQSQLIEFTTYDGRKAFLVPKDQKDKMMTLNIDEVVVTAKVRSRTLPERNGKVLIDFVITLPKQLQGDCQSVVVTPVMHNRDEIKPLEPLTIRGGLFSKVQDRNYWQYDRYLTLFKPDSAGDRRAYERFVKNPYPQGARLDSIKETNSTLTYFYTQEVPTDGVGDKVQITQEGRVVALDKSFYRLPLSDTLTFKISSMLHFADTATRYITKVIEKFAVVNDRNLLNFSVNETAINDTLAGNREQLGRIESLMDQLVNQKEFYLDSIILTASASPEGSVGRNNELAKGRAFALRDYLAGKFRRHRIDTMTTVRWVGEDWKELAQLVEENDKIRNRTQILERIAAARSAKSTDWDEVEKGIRQDYPDDYNVMLHDLYPLLRAVTFKYDLRRVGMLKDTIHTLIPDTMYARGFALLKDRRYTQALYYLDGYRDRNTVIAYLSIGEDKKALDLLLTFPKAPITEYLKAIACARLGRKEEGLEYYKEACAMDEKLEFRGALDPEITLLKQ